MQRKGYARKSLIPKEIQERLNQGHLPSANLVEWLSIDQKKLLKTWLQEQDAYELEAMLLKQVATSNTQSVLQQVHLIAKALHGYLNKDSYAHLWSSMIAHNSDMVRCWAAFCVPFNNKELAQSVEAMRRFACDTHFAVREIAWLALRNEVVANLREALDCLTQYTADTNENMRRFISEITRPRGVWCKHIAELKQNPDIGLVLLESLRADPSRYVQNSVANWLNDASKTQPEWVKILTQRWQQQSNVPATHYIIKRALRTMR